MAMRDNARRRRWGRSALVVAAVITITGCGSGGVESGSETSPSDATPTSTTSGPVAAPTSSPTVVTAELYDFRIELSQTSFTAGTYTFVVQEEGQAPHALSIVGPGVDSATTPVIEPGGESQELTVTLQSGQYELWCPVGNHKARGMVLTVTAQ
jgi:hypothetical protein